jgi:hypothetical protein
MIFGMPDNSSNSGCAPTHVLPLSKNTKTWFDRYEDNAEFRAIVREIATGLGLQVLQASRWGLVLAPTSGSVFGMNWSDYRSSKQLSADDRLLDGLIHIAIMATVFPRAQDLEDDPALVRPPITADDVETMLRGLCASMEEESRGKPDPASNELGLYQAWRVYQKRSSEAKTSSGRKSHKATRKLIENGLEFLRKHGCFVYRKTGDREAYQACPSLWPSRARYDVSSGVDHRVVPEDLNRLDR